MENGIISWIYAKAQGHSFPEAERNGDVVPRGSAERKVAFVETPVALIKEVRCADGSIFIIC